MEKWRGRCATFHKSIGQLCRFYFRVKSKSWELIFISTLSTPFSCSDKFVLQPYRDNCILPLWLYSLVTFLCCHYAWIILKIKYAGGESKEIAIKILCTRKIRWIWLRCSLNRSRENGVVWVILELLLSSKSEFKKIVEFKMSEFQTFRHHRVH